MQVMINCVFVGLGGMLGAVARYLLGLIPVREMGGFPLITLGINVLGALVIGLHRRRGAGEGACGRR